MVLATEVVLIKKKSLLSIGGTIPTLVGGTEANYEKKFSR
jgi:hypothetical protein